MARRYEDICIQNCHSVAIWGNCSSHQCFPLPKLDKSDWNFSFLSLTEFVTIHMSESICVMTRRYEDIGNQNGLSAESAHLIRKEILIVSAHEKSFERFSARFLSYEHLREILNRISQKSRSREVWVQIACGRFNSETTRPI